MNINEHKWTNYVFMIINNNKCIINALINQNNEINELITEN